MTIGDRIKEMRISHGMTQLDLARVAGVSDKAVSTWEKGANTPRMGAIQKMADYFHVSKGYLIGEDDGFFAVNVQPQNALAPDDSPLPDINSIDYALSGEIRCLSDAEKEDVLDYIRFKRAQKARKDNA